MFEDSFCKKKPNPTSFGSRYLENKSKTCFQDLHFLAIYNTKYYIQYTTLYTIHYYMFTIYSFFLNKNRKIT